MNTLGVKAIENRTWCPNTSSLDESPHGHWLAIHESGGSIIGCVELLGVHCVDPFADMEDHLDELVQECAALLKPKRDYQKRFDEYVKKFANQQYGLYWWILGYPQMLSKPIPAKGKLGIWTV